MKGSVAVASALKIIKRVVALNRWRKSIREKNEIGNRR
jgi:hypothetical protein